MSILGAIGGLVGGLFSSKSAEKLNRQNLEAQREAAQNQVSWRVADAKKAGVGTLAALGMNPISISPSTVGGPDWSSIGQNAGNSLQSTMSPDQKDDDYDRTIKMLTIDRMKAENNIVKNNAVASSVALATQPGFGPGIPDPAGSPEGFGSWQDKKPEQLRFGGLEIERNPHFADAEVLEKRYGEPGDWAAGASNMAADAYWNLKGAMARAAQRRDAQNAARFLLGQRRRSRVDHSYW